MTKERKKRALSRRYGHFAHPLSNPEHRYKCLKESTHDNFWSSDTSPRCPACHSSRVELAPGTMEELAAKHPTLTANLKNRLEAEAPKEAVVPLTEPEVQS